MGRQLLIIIAFVVLYFAFRLPAYPPRMHGEDGVFAAILLKQPTNPKYILVARFHDVDKFDPSTHPALEYEVMKASALITGLSSRWQQIPAYWLTTLCRLTCSLYEFVFFLGLLLVLLFGFQKRDISVLALFGFALSPLAINTSSWLQIDNTAGVVALGIFALVTVWALGHGRSRHLPALVFVGGLFSGTGKNEWAIMFLLSLVCATVFLWAFPQAIQGQRRKEYTKFIALAVVGALVGNLINYIYSPVDYVNGFLFMLGGGGVFPEGFAAKLAIFFQYTRERFPILLPLVLGLGFCFYALWEKRKPINFLIVVGLIMATGFFSMYFFSLAYPTPRYFAPSFIIMVSTLSMIVLDGLTARSKKVLVTLLAFIFLHTLSSTYHRTRELFVPENVEKPYVDKPIFKTFPPDCVPLVDGFGLLFAHEFYFAGEGLIETLKCRPRPQ